MKMVRSRSGVRSAAIRLFAVALATYAMLGSTRNADAGTITVYVNDLTGNGWETAATATGPSPLTAFNFSYTTTDGAFELDIISAKWKNGPLGDVQSSNLAIQNLVAATSTALDIAVVATGFTSPTAPPIFVWSVPSGAGNGLVSATFQAYVDSGTNPASLANGQGVQTATVIAGVPVFTPLATFIPSSLPSGYSVAQYFHLITKPGGVVTALGAETQLSTVPEPTSMAMLGVGLAGMGGYGWRRRKAAANREAPTIVV